MRIRSLVALTAATALSLGLAACGGSSSSGSASSGESTPVISAGGGSASSGSISGGSGFCGDAKGKLAGLQAQLAQIATSGTQKDQLKKELQTWKSYTQSAEADAPSEIKGDIAVIADFINHVSDGYAQAGYDPMKAIAVVGPYIQQNDAKLQTASNHIQAWAQANCGL
ncbi:MAG TPA: hypothetical protein VFJ66_08945 [Gaiellales bacterium]|nr:hypothetical protein [Gaiellales bacterium]